MNLKIGQFVKLRDVMPIGVVLDRYILFHSVNGDNELYSWYMDLKLVDENLRYTKNSMYDIMTVYNVQDGRFPDTQGENNFNILWEREELSPQQIKIQELEETIKKVQQQIGIGELKEEVNE